MVQRKIAKDPAKSKIKAARMTAIDSDIEFESPSGASKPASDYDTDKADLKERFAKALKRKK